MSRHPVLLGALGMGIPLLVSCSGGPTLAPSPARLMELETVHRDDPAGYSVAALLGAAYLHEGRIDEARRVLTEARSTVPGDLELAFLLGLTEEADGHAAGAADLYAGYAEEGATEPYAYEARGRADRIELALLPERMAGLLARESELASNPPDPRRVVMLPFAADRNDPRSEPLARALADLTPFDLQTAGLFTAVDRGRVRALLQAMGVTAAEVTDPRIAERVGRLLGAGIVVQGEFRVFDDFYVRLTSNVLVLGDGAARSVSSAEAEALMAQMGSLERRLALLIVESAGIEWSDGVRRRFGEGSTQHMPAWLDYGRGLIAFEAEEYELAESSFRSAFSLDNGFDRALERARAARFIAASTEPPDEIAWRAAQVGVQRHGVLALSGGASRQRAMRGLSAERRAVLAELLGQDRVGSGSIIELIFGTGGAGR